MAFDITKSLVPQTLPTAGPTRSVDKLSGANSNAKPEKAPFTGRSFREELASETAKNTQPVSRRESDRPGQAATKGSTPKGNGRIENLTSEVSDSPENKVIAEMDLELLKQFGAENEDEILNSPIAALLAGSLQSVNPGELPELIKGNKFLSAALFGADSGAVLEQMGEPADLFEMLDIPQELIVKLKDLLSNDQNGQVNLAQIFASFGLDPAFVTSQLKALRAQFAPELAALPVDAEFAKPVVAEGLTTSAAASVKNTKNSFAKITDKMPLALNQESLASEKPIGIAQFGVKQVGAEKINTDQVGVEKINTEQVGAGQDGIEQVGAVLAGLAGLGIDAKAVNQIAGSEISPDDSSVNPLPSLDLFDGFKRWRDLAPADARLTPIVAMQDTAAGAVQGPMAKSATFDAFYQLGQKIDLMSPEQVTKIDSKQMQEPVEMLVPVVMQDPVVKQESVEIQVKAPSFMEAVINRFGATGQLKTFDGKQALAGGLGELQTMTVVPVEQNGSEQIQQSKNPVQVANGVITAAVKTPALNPKNMIDTSVRKFTVDELFGDVTAGRLNLSVAKPDSEMLSDSEGGDLSQSSGEKFMGTVNPAAHKPLAFGSEFSAQMTQNVDGTVMSTAQRAEMVQKVMDSASYLVRQGTGSVKLDLSSAETGALQIAISLQDNKVDIKVFTESDPVREAMVADLSRLKESLQAQNVNLNHVEVGVGQRFAGSGSSDQGRQFAQQQEMREAFENLRPSFAANLAKSVDSSNIPAASVINRMNQISSDGRVQIRI